MNFRHKDQIDTAVQSAIECKICNLWIDVALLSIVHFDHKKIFSLRVQCFCHIRTESRESAFVICHFLSIYIHASGQCCCQHFYIDTVSIHTLWCLKAFCIPACSAVVFSSSVLAIYSVPCVRQIYFCPVTRKFLRKSDIFFLKIPVFI